MPLSTTQIQERTGYGIRHGQLVYTVLARLHKAGQVERSTARVKPVYWRTLTTDDIDPASLPPLITTDQDGGLPS